MKRANFWEAKLIDAILDFANLEEAKLLGANLTNAHIVGANLTAATLSRADLNGATMGGLNLANILDLCYTKGLDKVKQTLPSTLGMDTIQFSEGIIPTSFLQGCGLNDSDIEYAKLYNRELSNQEIDDILYRIHDLRAQQPFQISPLFISYSHSDSKFVDHLEIYLNKKGIRFWRDVHDATSGKLEKQIERAIRYNPIVLLILSEHSIKSDWVEHEVRLARDLEKETERDVLCPIALDESWKLSKWPKRIMEQVMEYYILDFSDWNNDNKFQKIFDKLIDGLNLYYKE